MFCLSVFLVLLAAESLVVCVWQRGLPAQALKTAPISGRPSLYCAPSWQILWHKHLKENCTAVFTNSQPGLKRPSHYYVPLSHQITLIIHQRESCDDIAIATLFADANNLIWKDGSSPMDVFLSPPKPKEASVIQQSI